MPPEGYLSISVKEEVADRLRERKPNGVTLSRYLESLAFDEEMSRTSTHELDAIAAAVAERVDAGGTVDARIVDMDVTEREALAREVAEVLQG